MFDFIKKIKSWSIEDFADRLSAYWNTKSKALEFLSEIFKIWEFPDEMKIDSSGKFIYKKPTQTQSGSKNDLMIDRITAKSLAKYEWESLSELCGNSTSKKFYEFALTCFFAWVKLKL